MRSYLYLILWQGFRPKLLSFVRERAWFLRSNISWFSRSREAGNGNKSPKWWFIRVFFCKISYKMEDLVAHWTIGRRKPLRQIVLWIPQYVFSWVCENCWILLLISLPFFKYTIRKLLYHIENLPRKTNIPSCGVYDNLESPPTYPQNAGKRPMMVLRDHAHNSRMKTLRGKNCAWISNPSILGTV